MSTLTDQVIISSSSWAADALDDTLACKLRTAHFYLASSLYFIGLDKVPQISRGKDYIWTQANKNRQTDLRLRTTIFIQALSDMKREIGCYVLPSKDNSRLLVATKYFTMGLKYVMEHQVHHYITKHVPLYFFRLKIRHPSIPIVLNTVPTDNAIIDSHFKREIVRNEITIHAGEYYFFVCPAHCIFSLTVSGPPGQAVPSAGPGQSLVGPPGLPPVGPPGLPLVGPPGQPLVGPPGQSVPGQSPAVTPGQSPPTLPGQAEPSAGHGQSVPPESPTLPGSGPGVLPESPTLPGSGPEVLPESPTLPGSGPKVLPEQTHGVLPEQTHGVLPGQSHGVLPEQTHGVLPGQSLAESPGSPGVQTEQEPTSSLNTPILDLDSLMDSIDFYDADINHALEQELYINRLETRLNTFTAKLKALYEEMMEK